MCKRRDRVDIDMKKVRGGNMPLKVFYSHKAVIWLQKTWNIVHKSCGLLLYCFNAAF